MDKKFSKTVLEFDPFEGDFGEQADTVFSDKIVKVRKGRHCSHCGTQIVVGEYARSMAAKFDGELMSYTWCAECCNLMHSIVVSEESGDEDYDMNVLYRKWDQRASR